MPDLKFSNKNIENIKPYVSLVDHNFITTDTSIVKNKFKSKNFNFFFVPVDSNIERFNVYNLHPKNDIFYAKSFISGKLEDTNFIKYFFFYILIKIAL